MESLGLSRKEVEELVHKSMHDWHADFDHHLILAVSSAVATAIEQNNEKIRQQLASKECC